ncbi:hypothetical protein ACPXCT_16050, partial [Escherichia coli]
KTSIFSHPVYLFLREFSLQDFRGGSAWANDVRTMRMLDGRSHRQICEMFGRVQRDQFWVKNIMSPSKLREKWDELVIRLGRSPVQRCVNHISEPDTEIPPGFRG